MKRVRNAQAILTAIALGGSSAAGETSSTNAPAATSASSKLRAEEDGWLDYHGIGEGGRLADNPLAYSLEPMGVFLQAKYRLGDSCLWAGLSYAFATTQVSFEAPTGGRRGTISGGLTEPNPW